MKLKSYTLLLTALSLTACAHSVEKFNYPSTTNATSEIQRLDGEMQMAQNEQVNLLSPNHFADARESLRDAKKASQDEDSNAEVLEDLGYARAHLDAAIAVAPRVRSAMPEVLQAREHAILAEAPRLRASELKEVDEVLRNTAEDFESEKTTVSVEKRGELQKKYINLEIASIKANYLGEAKALIETAKKMDAKKYAKTTLMSAESKYQAAEKTIATDRHNTAAIFKVSTEARDEAKRAVEITKMAKGIKNQTPEESAIALEAKRNQAERSAALAARNAAIAEDTSEQLSTAEETIANKDATIAGKNSQLTTIGATATELERNKRFNDAFSKAQKSFTSDEAVVYRQGDKLVVRLKSVQFPTGTANLPDESMGVLDKVKGVIESMGAENVLVEGHTDASGSKALNMELSKKRAEVVAEYFVKDEAIASDHVETKGFGDTRPLVTNKTKDGRAQNRRVDVIISPPKL
jgi:OmpA-OmpF porin, OOP family